MKIMNLIDGRALAQKIRIELKEKIAASGLKPGLGVILVGDDPASRLYVSLKEKACAEVGIHFEKYLFSAAEPEEEVIRTIKQLNNSTIIHGILVQLPLPSHLATDKIMAAINPAKDADGFHPQNLALLKAGRAFIEPVLLKAIWTLITASLHHLNTTSLSAQGPLRSEASGSASGGEHFNTETLKRLKTLIIGRSDVFTESLEIFLRQKGLDATHLHPAQIPNTKYQILNTDILIIAVGRPNFLRGDDFKEGAIVIDVGINRLPDNKIVGDVNLESAKQKNGWITPVPGGVGPMTVAMLLENVYLLSSRNFFPSLERACPALVAGRG